MGCFESLSKVLLIIVNVVFLLASMLMFSLGITLVVAPDKLISFVQNNGVNLGVLSDATGGFFDDIIHASGIFMIILGLVVMIVSFLGFVGACCENSCMLGTYGFILIVVLLAEIALIIFAAVYPKVFKEKAADVMFKTLQSGFHNDVQLEADDTLKNQTEPVDLAWMVIQFQFKCCGAHNYTDYSKFDWNRCGSTYPSCSNSKVPVSCCVLKNGENTFPSKVGDFVDLHDCLQNAGSDSTNYEGCAERTYTTATDAIMEYSKIAIGIAAGIAGIELVLIVLAFCLCCADRG